MAKKKSQLYIDDTCTICVGVGRVVESIDMGVTIKNANADKPPKGASRNDLQHTLHFVDESGKTHTGIDAVLQSFRVTWYGRILYGASRFWPIHVLFSFVYSLVSRNRHFISSQVSRPVILAKNITAIGFLLGIAASWRLWFWPQDFPTLPLWNSLELPEPANLFLSILLTLALLATLFARRWQPWALHASGVYALICVTDQMHMQPWAYLYAWILTLIAILTLNKVRPPNIIAILRFILAAVYIFSGAYKINPDFPDIMAWMTQNVVTLDPADDMTITASLSIALAELVMGVFLLVRRARVYAMIGLIGMHLSIVALLSPWGLNWNAVIWPWNLTMIVLLITIVLPKLDRNTFQSAWREKYAAIVVGIFFFVLPSAGFFGWWDNYLSFSLYSGNITEGYIEPAQAEYVNAYGLGNAPSVSKIAIRELGAPSIPEERFLRAYFAWDCEYRPYATMTIYRRMTLLRPELEVVLVDCNDI